jgi:hypothetical protein
MAVGAVAYFYVKDTASTIKQNREIERQSREEQEAHSEIETMIDDVVHRDDIPETPVKAAFESALGTHEHQT